MREVFILGLGMHKFGRYLEKPYTEFGRVAIVEALKDSGVDWRDIQAVYAGSAIQGMAAGHNVCAEIGKTGVPIFNVEQACGSGSGAMQLAYHVVAGGIFDLVCAMGFEKQGRGFIPAENYPQWARRMGMAVYPAWHAQEAQRHMHEYGTTLQQLAKVAVNSHRHASLCPYAHYQEWGNMTIEDVLNSRLICYPITMYMIPPADDGGAAVILGSKEMVRKYATRKPVSIAASIMKTSVPNKEESSFAIGGGIETELAAKQAYQTAGAGPEDMDVVECVDAFAIGEILTAEALGFCPKGEGGRFIGSGKTELGGQMPFNTDGGYTSRGNAMGATGLAGIVEIARQLRGEADRRQVPNAKIGLAHSLGAGVNAFITILQR